MTEPIRKPIPLAGLIGFRVEVDAANTSASCLLDITPVHLNRHGVLHGGVISTLLDTTSGVTASMTVDAHGLTPFTTVSLNINFLAPVQAGQVRATGRVSGGGRSLTFVEAEVRDADGRKIATSTGVFKRVRPKEPAP
ncbi:uncharacterized domain 1-containing protein [Shimia gijangensis]|uniref:Uncharacterized domain 1-containing protein n=1 Tax=Shimia gijangensis TaxID=1470563 RepID=A0A1M6I800_9RHOB|nr:PaaI family thioesterase [Shimia gijangensis]SHJ30594.1 uncharacterized domain 1-containing protein [Shimia gijangensis]